MEPKFQTSFIPKAPIANGGTSSGFEVKPPRSIIGTFSTLFFVLALIASGALFGYERYVDSQITQSQNTLNQARAAFESADNQKVILVSNQLKSIKTLLDRHTVISPLFQLLEKQTLPTVRLSSFTFNRNPEGVVSVVIEGEAQNYASLAQQTGIFSKEPFFKKMEFSDLTLSDSGTVKTKLKMDLDSELLLYTKKIQSVSTVEHNSQQL